jgi:hypothetical protein
MIEYNSRADEREIARAGVLKSNISLSFNSSEYGYFARDTAIAALQVLREFAKSGRLCKLREIDRKKIEAEIMARFSRRSI